MTPSFERLQDILKRLPGLGYRSSERIALNLTVEKPDILPKLVEALQQAKERIRRCQVCGNLCEAEQCDICQHPKRNRKRVCVVEQVPDLVAIERAGAFFGTYHVLHGKLAPIDGIGPGDLNLEALSERVEADSVEEVILALSNDIEGEATCHYIREIIMAGKEVRVSRIGFGLPSGGGIVYADAITLKSAIDGRRTLD